MWTEEKGRRFEELRKRTIALTESERAELQEMTTELEGSESGFMDENTRRKLLAMERVNSRNQPVSLRIIGKSALIGTMLAMCAGALYAYLDFDSEPAPILSEKDLILTAVILAAPIGLVAGTVVGCLLLPAPSAR